MRSALAVGFYAVLDRDDVDLARALVIAGGARVLQVRLKPGSASDIVRVAQMARQICTEGGAMLVINDRVDIALAVGADAVHLGQTDLPLAAARAIAGDRLEIGISTHNPQQVQAAISERPAYIAYGPVFETTTKENPDPVQGLEALREAVRLATAANIPVVAIGGITPARARDAFATGVTAVCAISAVNRASNVAATARALHNPSKGLPVGRE